MTEAEHNRQIPKFFGNRPLALADEVFGETIDLAIYQKCVFIIAPKLKRSLTYKKLTNF